MRRRDSRGRLLCNTWVEVIFAMRESITISNAAWEITGVEPCVVCCVGTVDNIRRSGSTSICRVNPVWWEWRRTHCLHPRWVHVRVRWVGNASIAVGSRRHVPLWCWATLHPSVRHGLALMLISVGRTCVWKVWPIHVRGRLSWWVLI